MKPTCIKPLDKSYRYPMYDSSKNCYYYFIVIFVPHVQCDDNNDDDDDNKNFETDRSGLSLSGLDRDLHPGIFFTNYC